MCRSSSTSSTWGPLQSRKLWNRAASASGHQNGLPSASMADTPRRGTSTAVGPFAALALWAISLPSASFSWGVVRIRVTVGLCW